MNRRIRIRSAQPIVPVMFRVVSCIRSKAMAVSDDRDGNPQALKIPGNGHACS